MAKTKTDKQSRKKRDKSILNGTVVAHKKSSRVQSTPTENPEVLITEANALVQSSEPHRALSVAQRALNVLEARGGSLLDRLSVLNLLGEIHVELGDVDSARQIFLAAVALDTDSSAQSQTDGGAEKFLWLAQLCEEGGRESVAWFQKGVAVLRKVIGELEHTCRPDNGSLLDEMKIKLANALCGMIEVYMTDLSWEDDAETWCEQLITEALLIAPTAPEPLQTLASVRISQLKFDDARAALSRSVELWQDLSSNDSKVPAFATRVSLARLLMEVEMEEEAIGVLERLVAEDDTSVEAWYLGGWCLHLMGQKRLGSEVKYVGGEQQDSEWKSLWLASRDWLKNGLKLYEAVDYEDERLRDHARELVGNLNEGLGSMGEDGEGISLQDKDEGWEDEDDMASMNSEDEEMV